MSEDNKIAVYETFVEDMIRTIEERMHELEGEQQDLFEAGRQMAYFEMMDIIRTRHRLIYDVLTD